MAPLPTVKPIARPHSEAQLPRVIKRVAAEYSFLRAAFRPARFI
jgi:hypothetical protein